MEFNTPVTRSAYHVVTIQLLLSAVSARIDGAPDNLVLEADEHATVFDDALLYLSRATDSTLALVVGIQRPSRVAQACRAAERAFEMVKSAHQHRRRMHAAYKHQETELALLVKSLPDSEEVDGLEELNYFSPARIWQLDVTATRRELSNCERKLDGALDLEAAAVHDHLLSLLQVADLV